MVKDCFPVMREPDICRRPDSMSAKLSHVECFLNPIRAEFHIQKTPLKLPKLSLTNSLAY